MVYLNSIRNHKSVPRLWFYCQKNNQSCHRSDLFSLDVTSTVRIFPLLLGRMRDTLPTGHRLLRSCGSIVSTTVLSFKSFQSLLFLVWVHGCECFTQVSFSSIKISATVIKELIMSSSSCNKTFEGHEETVCVQSVQYFNMNTSGGLHLNSIPHHFSTRHPTLICKGLKQSAPVGQKGVSIVSAWRMVVLPFLDWQVLPAIFSTRHKTTDVF